VKYQQEAPTDIPEKLCHSHPFKSWGDYEASKSSWFSVKDTVMGDYHSPNLPYLIHGDTKLSESNAILRYIGGCAVNTGKCRSVMGTTAGEAAANEFVLEKAMELRNKVILLGYSTFAASMAEPTPPDETGQQCWERSVELYREGKIPNGFGLVIEKLPLAESNALYEKYLNATPGTYFAGENVTVCDFHMYELLCQQKLMLGDGIYDDSPKVQAFVAAFGALPKIVEAYAKWGSLPCNNTMSWTTQLGF
jgi:glutathione S-transferase